MNAVPPRQWSITTLSAPDGALAVHRNGAPLAALAFDQQLTPVELLLIAVGNCFALSCHAAMAARQRERVAFAVRVTGTKAADLPSRLATIDVQIAFSGRVPPDEAAALAAHAKRLCTVSNTLAAAPACTVVAA
jgi:uncharacterized OsmC-like protein